MSNFPIIIDLTLAVISGKPPDPVIGGFGTSVFIMHIAA